MYPFLYVRAAHCNAIAPQATKSVRASHSDLIEIFERLEAFFKRLEVYTSAALNQEMMDIVTKIIVEVLNIVGMMTKEIKQSRTSTSFCTKKEFS